MAIKNRRFEQAAFSWDTPPKKLHPEHPKCLNDRCQMSLVSHIQLIVCANYS